MDWKKNFKEAVAETGSLCRELVDCIDGLIQGMLLLILALALYILFTFIFDFEAKADVFINVDKTSQEMTVFVDGEETYTWPVSTGKPGYDTPVGDYGLNGMHEIWYSKQWDNAPMPHAIFFTKKGHAIHGTNEVVNLGSPASHGCVRLSQENAAILYDLVSEHGEEATKVALGGQIDVPEATVAENEWDAPEGPYEGPEGLPYEDYYGPPPPPAMVYVRPPRPYLYPRRYWKQQRKLERRLERMERRRWRRGW